MFHHLVSSSSKPAMLHCSVVFLVATKRPLDTDGQVRGVQLVTICNHTALSVLTDVTFSLLPDLMLS